MAFPGEEMMRERTVFFLICILIICAGCSSAQKEAIKTPATETKDDLSPADTASDTVSDADKAKPAEPSSSMAREEGKAGAVEKSESIAAAKKSKRDGGGKEYAGAPSKESGRRSAPVPEASGLKAGYADDNKQYNFFIQFLEKYKKDVISFPIAIEERILVRVKDSRGKSIPNAKVSVRDEKKKLLVEGRTYADGTFLFFPSEYDKKIETYHAIVTAGRQSKDISIPRKGKREVEIVWDTERQSMTRIPLDLLFVMDTTGSMGEEIARLKSTIEIINMNLASMAAKPRIRFGMILYRDQGDDYVTKVIPFTENLDEFRTELDRVEAGGGGDGPEDLQSALKDAMGAVKWNSDGIRLAFVITDAPAHLDYKQDYTYVNAAHDARKQAVKIFTVGTGGLDISGEYILRQVSQYTYARYIFLTYGERGESEGGKEGSVSHHTGSNFQTDKLETIIIRFAREELAFLSDSPLEEGDDFFQAKKIADEKKEETLSKLFDMAIPQLVDYSSWGIEPGTTASIVPLSVTEGISALNAEYFTEQMTIALSHSKVLKMVERKDIQKILKELELQNTGIMDEETAAKFGKLVGARILVSGTIYSRKDFYEVFLKLLRVETGEVLAVTKLKLDRDLGLSK